MNNTSTHVINSVQKLKTNKRWKKKSEDNELQQ